MVKEDEFVQCTKTRINKIGARIAHSVLEHVFDLVNVYNVYKTLYTFYGLSRLETINALNSIATQSGKE